MRVATGGALGPALGLALGVGLALGPDLGPVGGASAARAQALDVQYRVTAETPGNAVDSGDQRVPVQADSDYEFQDESITASALASGGSVPTVDAVASAGVTSTGQEGFAFASIRYTYRVQPIAGSTRPAVPLVISTAGEAMAMQTDPLGAGGSLASVEVFAPGDSNNPIYQGSAIATVNSVTSEPFDSFSGTVSTVAPVGEYGRISMRAQASVRVWAEAQAVADPIIRIDPQATFDEGGQTIRYADAFEVAYPDTIVQYVPEPGGAVAAGAALAALAGLGSSPSCGRTSRSPGARCRRSSFSTTRRRRAPG